MECRQCGETHRRCRSHNGAGRPCGKYPIAGGTVCATHGGSAPQVRAAAAHRLALAEVEADAARVLAHEAVSPLTDPLDELARLAAEAIGWKDALAARVNALTELRYAAAGGGGYGTEQIRAEVVLLERAMDRCARFVDLLAKHDWIGKRFAIDEAVANAVISAFAAAVSEAGVTVEQRLVLERVFLAGINRPDGIAADTVAGEVEA